MTVTPAFLAPANLQLRPDARGKTTLALGTAKDLTGAAVDISTGYTGAVVCRPANQQNPVSNAAQLDTISGATLHLNSDGTITLDLPFNWSSILQSLANVIDVYISTDSFTTYAVISAGQLTVQFNV